jgi:hypothetical protein
MIPNRWLSESRHVGFRFEYCRPRGGEFSPSASGSEDVLRVAQPIRPRTGLRWARSTEADGEGDVREARATKSAPVALDKGPLIDGVPGTSRNSAAAAWGYLKKLERDAIRRLTVLGEEPGASDLLASGGPPTTEGSERRAERWYRLVKISKRAEKDGGESERPLVSPKRGNHPEGPRGEKGMPCHDTVGGKHGGCIETRGRVHETTTDRGSELMM